MTSALSVVLSLALGATVSQSRFGIVATGSGTGLSTIVAGCPRAVDTAPPLTGATAEAVLATYRSQCTGGVELLELPAVALAPVQLTLQQGQLDADTYWGFYQSLAFAGVTTTSLRWVAGPANLFQVADPNAIGMSAYVNGFVGELATKIAQRAVVDGATYALLVPPWTSTTPGAFCDVVAAARAADARIGWSWSASTGLPATVTDEATTTFGYRTVRTACSLQGVPLFAELTATGGWFSGGRTASQVVTWMTAMDQAVASDTDVVTGGALLLRSVGGGGLDDLGPAAAEISTFLGTPVQNGGGGGTSTGGTSGAFPPETTGPGGTLLPASGHRGCGNPAGAASLLALAPLALRLRRRR